MKVAFYKGTHQGIPGIYNRFVRWWERGPYSHCELIFSDGLAASSSFMDHGVRFKEIEFDPANWDFIELHPEFDEQEAHDWFMLHLGCGYDIKGNIRFGLGFLPNSENKYFCSESIAAALGMGEAWRYGPNGLYSALAYLQSMDTGK